jgi:ABC-2 type transport system ATP-binding protein
MEFVAELSVSVILSSHLVSDLERVCDYLVVLTASRVQVAGDVDAMLATHYRLEGARASLSALPDGVEVIESGDAGQQGAAVIRDYRGAVPGPPSGAQRLSLEELVLAYLGRATSTRGTAVPGTVTGTLINRTETNR